MNPALYKIIHDRLTKIGALCTNPHWTRDRKERIYELARECLDLLELSSSNQDQTKEPK